MMAIRLYHPKPTETVTPPTGECYRIPTARMWMDAGQADMRKELGARTRRLTPSIKGLPIKVVGGGPVCGNRPRA